MIDKNNPNSESRVAILFSLLLSYQQLRKFMFRKNFAFAIDSHDELY
jgi:hypothetical protein